MLDKLFYFTNSIYKKKIETDGTAIKVESYHKINENEIFSLKTRHRKLTFSQ